MVSNLQAAGSAPSAPLTRPAVTIADADARPPRLITTDSTWKYVDDGSNQGTKWRTKTFDDSTWKTGTAQLGYGGGESTTVGFGADASNKFITTYFRQSFNVANKATFNALQLRLLADDGAVVYLNGVEVFRSNMLRGTVAFSTRAAVALTGSEESSFVQVGLNPASLINGTNVLAVEVHQANRLSPDVRFDLELTALTTKPTLIQAGSVWKYMDNGSNRGTAWRGLSYNDSAWQSGSSELGYGDGDERTPIGRGPKGGTSNITTYFRTTFYAANVAAFNGLLLRLLADDGAVVYLNGVEVCAEHAPAPSSTPPWPGHGRIDIRGL